MGGVLLGERELGDGHVGPAFCQRLDAVDVIVVEMGDQDLGQRGARLLGLEHVGDAIDEGVGRFRRIDSVGRAPGSR